MMASTHSSVMGRLERSHSPIKSKQPLLLSTSTMVIVARKYSTTCAPRKIYSVNMLCAIKSFTAMALMACEEM